LGQRRAKKKTGKEIASRIERHASRHMKVKREKDKRGGGRRSGGERKRTAQNEKQLNLRLDSLTPPEIKERKKRVSQEPSERSETVYA